MPLGLTWVSIELIVAAQSNHAGAVVAVQKHRTALQLYSLCFLPPVNRELADETSTSVASFLGEAHSASPARLDCCCHICSVPSELIRSSEVINMAFSGAVKIGDLNDFIAPSQACVVSLQGGKLEVAADAEVRTRM